MTFNVCHHITASGNTFVIVFVIVVDGSRQLIFPRINSIIILSLSPTTITRSRCYSYFGLRLTRPDQAASQDDKDTDDDGDCCAETVQVMTTMMAT